VTLRFFSRPARLLGEERVTGVEVERTAVDGEGRAMGTGETELLPADLVVRSVGYRGCPLPGLPVDERTATVPNESGRVLRDGQPSAGEYVAGWIKRGPSGVVGTNKHDARETVAALLADAAEGRLVARGPVGDLVDELVARGAEPVLLDDWHAIDAAEVALGATRGRARTTLHEWETLMSAVRDASAARR
jgi:ferredoxin--NADP+ reductase